MKMPKVKAPDPDKIADGAKTAKNGIRIAKDIVVEVGKFSAAVVVTIPTMVSAVNEVAKLLKRK